MNYDSETRFSSFFMLLLSATGLVVILSQFMAGSFNYRTKAYSAPAGETYPVNKYPFLQEDGVYFEEENDAQSEYPAEENVEMMEEDVRGLEFELETTAEPSIFVEL